MFETLRFLRASCELRLVCTRSYSQCGHKLKVACDLSMNSAAMFVHEQVLPVLRKHGCLLLA